MINSTLYITAAVDRGLVVRVSVKPHSRNGVFTFTITLANCTSCQVRYNQR